MAGIDLLKAINKVSDVVHNRPRPLRQFDQIYMKTGDLVMQSDVVAGWAHGRRLAFIGDAVSVCGAYLRDPEILAFRPSKVTVFDFDERIVNAVKRFAEKKRIDGVLDAVWSTCSIPFPSPVAGGAWQGRHGRSLLARGGALSDPGFQSDGGDGNLCHGSGRRKSDGVDECLSERNLIQRPLSGGRRDDLNG